MQDQRIKCSIRRRPANVTAPAADLSNPTRTSPLSHALYRRTFRITKGNNSYAVRLQLIGKRARCTNRNTKRTHPTPRRENKIITTMVNRGVVRTRGTTNLSTPAAAISSTHWAGCDTIRWASSKAFVCFRKPLMTCERPRKSTQQQLRYAGRGVSTGTTQGFLFQGLFTSSPPKGRNASELPSWSSTYSMGGSHLNTPTRTGESWHSRFAVKRTTACVGGGNKNNIANCFVSLL